MGMETRQRRLLSGGNVGWGEIQERRNCSWDTAAGGGAEKKALWAVVGGREWGSDIGIVSV